MSRHREHWLPCWTPRKLGPQPRQHLSSVCPAQSAKYPSHGLWVPPQVSPPPPRLRKTIVRGQGEPKMPPAQAAAAG